MSSSGGANEVNRPPANKQPSKGLSRCPEEVKYLIFKFSLN